MSPVSACASKWIIETRPCPRTLATPLASGYAMEWSPPSTIGYGARPGHLLDGCLERRQCLLDVAGVHLDVAGVDDREVDQAVRAKGQARPGAVVREVVGHPDRHRPEPRARAVGGAAVEGRPEDHDVCVGIGPGVVQVAAGHAEEGDVRAELRAVARHGSDPHSANVVSWRPRARLRSRSPDPACPATVARCRAAHHVRRLARCCVLSSESPTSATAPAARATA